VVQYRCIDNTRRVKDMEVKLVIKLPDTLRRRAKARAAMEGTTLSDIVRQRLEEFAAGWDAIEEADDARVACAIEARIARGAEPLYDWEDVKAELNDPQDQAH
jgi:predicted DNA-binding protein